MIFTGTVIGAGFASGQELAQYFLKYGNSGIFGILLSIALFTLLAAVVLCKISVVKASNTKQYFGSNCPPAFQKIYTVLSISFMFITFCTMVTATGEMFEENLGVPNILGIIVMYVICTVAVKKGEKGTVAVNKILTPVIIIITVAIFVYASFGISKETFNISKLVYNPSTSAFVYVSYNTLGIIAVFTSVSNLVKNKTTAVLGALAGGFMLLITALCLWYILSTNNFEGAKIPVLAALDQLGKIIYMPVLFCAMVTTAVSCGFAVIKAVGMNENATIVLMILASYMISCIGFERLVADVYAIFGYIGFVIGIYTIIDGIKYLKR